MRIYINRDKPGYSPLNLYQARQIPLHFMDEAQKTIDMFVKSGVIESVAYPTEWTSPGFFVPKPDGRV